MLLEHIEFIAQTKCAMIEDLTNAAIALLYC